MTRDQRHTHALIWLIAAPIMLIMLTLIVAMRPLPPLSPTLFPAQGTLAILLLHIILAIGPLARLDDRVAPLLYNRRHLGVTFFLIALAHAIIAIGYYGGFGLRNPIAAVIAREGSFASISAFPFEFLGFLAL